MRYKIITCFIFCVTLFHSFLTAKATSDMTPEKALKQLMEGNKRYINDKLLHPNRTQERREAVLVKQNPFAVIMGCSDSRVSPEVVFDQGIGDLFIVRTAGNVIGPVEMETIQFGTLQLGASVILVLGHENCGAVKAVLTEETSSIPAIAKKIAPALRQYVGKPIHEVIVQATKDNIRAIVAQIKSDPEIANEIKSKKVEVMGGYYHLNSGEVELLN